MRDMVYSNRIEDYLAAIEGCDAFFVAERDYGRIINYRRMGSDVFPDPATAPDADTARLWGLRRQCRGLVFDLAGNVISPGFEKFFNLGECEETRAENVPFDQTHVILEKMDGSMIRPIPLADGGYRLGTKMGLTSVAEQPEEWVATMPNYDKFFRDLMGQGMVPLLEWCSRKQTVVLDHPVDRLVLLAVRAVHNGEYLPMSMMLELAADYDVEVVRRYPGTVASMQHLIDETRDLLGQEGWVVCFDNGYKLKLKAENYVTIHKAKENILRENGVIEMILGEKLDDIKAFLPKEDRENLDRFETEFWNGVANTAGEWQLAYMGAKSLFGADRKGFAMEWAPNFEPNLRSAIFKAWDNPHMDFRDAVVGVISKNLGSQTKVDEARHLWGCVEWHPHHMGDE